MCWRIILSSERFVNFTTCSEEVEVGPNSEVVLQGLVPWNIWPLLIYAKRCFKLAVVIIIYFVNFLFMFSQLTHIVSKWFFKNFKYKPDISQYGLYQDSGRGDVWYFNQEPTTLTLPCLGSQTKLWALILRYVSVGYWVRNSHFLSNEWSLNITT